MKKQASRLLNTIDNLYDSAYLVFESYEHDQQALFVARTEAKIYKTAFNQLKQFVQNHPILDENEHRSVEYLNGKLQAIHDIYNEIKIIEEINGLVPQKSKKEGF
ncbi:MAG: hypothetical protein ACI4TT_03820 [Christensenellales bacterium]